MAETVTDVTRFIQASEQIGVKDEQAVTLISIPVSVPYVHHIAESSSKIGTIDARVRFKGENDHSYVEVKVLYLNV